MKKLITILLVCSFSYAKSQSDSLPVKVLPSSDIKKPLIFFASGDGGWTKFSDEFIAALNKQGYPVVALNSKQYFWTTRTPEQTALMAGGLLTKYLAAWKRDSIILVGYSFGADITPFLQTHMDPAISRKIKQMVLLLPYKTTDFEIHLSEMMGFGRTDKYDVVAEVNKVSKPLLFVLGTEKSQFPVERLSIKNYQSIVIDGGHHFDDDGAGVAEKILKTIR